MEKGLPSAELVQRVRTGDAQAAHQLFERYAQRLTYLADQSLSLCLTAKVAGEDVVQSVFCTFFRRCARGDFRIDNSSQLWQLLVRITLRKAREEYRRHTAARRSMDREALAGEAWLTEAVAQAPGPQEAAAFVDEIRVLLEGLPPLYCHILEMRLQGHTVADIARQHQVSRQTIYQALHLLQERLLRHEDW